MEKLFKLRENNTTVGREIAGGVTTFFAMAYIIFVNPNFLSQAGMDFNAVMLATCISAAIGTALTALLANVPFAQAPGMGLNAFFTFTVCFGMGYSWQQALAIVFISGLLFLAVTVSPLRKQVINAIPAPLKNAISAGIGLFIALVGLLNAGIVVANDNLLDLGKITSGAPLLALIGLLVTGILMACKVKAAMLIGILITTVIGIPMGLTVMPEEITLSSFSVAPTFMKMDFAGLLSMGVLPLVTAIITFSICDMFDTVGTLIGTAGNAGMLDENGELPRGDRALVADALATCVGACMGTSTVTTFVESSTGISEGARTGLSSMVVSLCFLASCILAPVAGIIPSAATAPALIIVGILMLKAAARIDWSDFEVAMPCFLTIAMMPFGYSITDGIGFGFISWVVLKVFRGKAKEVPVLMYLLSVLFVAMYILSNL